MFSYDVTINPAGYDAPTCDFIQDAIDASCSLCDNATQITTPDGLFDDASGNFLLHLYENDTIRMVATWYVRKESNVEHGTGYYDPDLGFNGIIEATHHVAGRCDECGKYVGADNLHSVGFANAACDECIDAMRARLEYPGWAD